MTGAADITGAHPDVDALAAKGRQALENLRLAGRTDKTLRLWADEAIRVQTALAALARDAAETKANAERYAETIRWFWAKLAPGKTYADLEGQTIHGLLEALLADRDRLARRVEQLERALRKYGRHLPACTTLKAPGLGRDPAVTGQHCDCGFAAVLAASTGPDETCRSLYPGGHGEQRECVLRRGHEGAHRYASTSPEEETDA